MITNEQIFKSLIDGWPNKAWSLPMDYQDFDAALEWLDESPKPTLTEIEAHYQIIAYIDQRIAAYPPLGEQLDMMYNLGYQGWHDAIEAIKNEFPAP